MIRRSRARADAAAIVEDLDEAITDAVESAAGSLGFEASGRADDGDRHRLSFRAPDDTALEVSVGKVTGQAMAVRDGQVDLDVSCTSTSYGGGADAGTGEHGEIVVAMAEGGSASMASISLVLPLADYTSEDMSPDEEGLRRDMAAVIASVRHRLD